MRKPEQRRRSVALFSLYRYIQSLYFLNLKFQASIFCSCTAHFVSDLVGNPEDKFSQDAAHLKVQDIRDFSGISKTGPGSH